MWFGQLQAYIHGNNNSKSTINDKDYNQFHQLTNSQKQHSQTCWNINKVKTKQNNLVDSRKGVYHLRERNNVRINYNHQQFYL